jgi:F-type H+-transporting ATPase subunit epsilon
MADQGQSGESGKLSLEVVTRTGVALRTSVEEIEAPSVFGEFGVLPGHLPLLAALNSGVLTWHSKGAAKRAVIGPGFAEVGPAAVLVLTEHFVPEDDIDPDATRETLGTVRGQLEKLAEAGVTSGARFDEYSARAQWCEAQLALVETWLPGRRGGTKGGESH